MAHDFELKSVGVFGVTTGQDCWPSSLTDFIRPFYLQAASQPREVLFVERMIIGWAFSYVNYRFIGSGGRSNSHFGITAIYQGIAPFAPKEAWRIFSVLFNFLEQSGKVFQQTTATADDGGPIFQFSVSSFERIDRAWLQDVLSQLTQHAASIEGSVYLLAEPRTFSSGSKGTNYFDLDEDIGVSLEPLLRGERAAFAVGLGKKATKSKAQEDSLARTIAELAATKERVQEYENQLAITGEALNKLSADRDGLQQNILSKSVELGHKDEEITRLKASAKRSVPPVIPRDEYSSAWGAGYAASGSGQYPRNGHERKTQSGRGLSKPRGNPQPRFGKLFLVMLLLACCVGIAILYFKTGGFHSTPRGTASAGEAGPNLFSVPASPHGDSGVNRRSGLDSRAGKDAPIGDKGKAMSVRLFMTGPGLPPSSLPRLFLSGEFLQVIAGDPPLDRQTALERVAAKFEQEFPKEYKLCVGISARELLSTIRSKNPNNFRNFESATVLDAKLPFFVRAGLNPEAVSACNR